MEKRWTPKGWEWNIEGTWTLGRKAPPFTSFITPKPSPFAWPAKLSTEISKYPELVDPELFAQAKSYSSHIQRLTAEGFTPAAAAKTLQQRGYRFFGWSKKLLSTIQAPSIPPQQLTPEFISRWNREALLTRLSTAVKQGPFEPVPMPEFYRGIAGRAGRFGLGQELLSRMGPATPEMLSEMISPSSWYQKATRVGKGFGEQIWRAPTGFKVGLGLAIGLLGLYALQPGSYFNGFSESGIGPQKRKELTDFGSGYRGILRLPKILEAYESARGLTLPNYVTYAASLTKRIMSGSGNFIHKTKALKEVVKLSGKIATSPFRDAPVIINVGAIEREATEADVKHSVLLKHTIAHERWHQMSVLTGFRAQHASLYSRLPKSGVEYLRNTYNGLSDAGLVEEYLAFSAEHFAKPGFRRISQTSGDPAVRWIGRLSQRRLYFSGKDDTYNTIEGLGEKGIGSQLRKLLTDFGSGYKGLDFNRDDTVSSVERKFGRFARALKKYGVEVGTAHKRIYIPKDIVSEEELTKELGFIPVKIAIPEAGQSRFESFRHPNVLYHLHEHDDVWVMHEDVHPSATMVFKKWMAEKARGAGVTVGGLAKGVWASMSHIIEEGIPGAYYYLKGLASETDDMRRRIEKEVSAKYKGLVKRWRKEFSKENVFSGFGRAYNSIEGLFHGGQAEKKRRELTDFGSGWRGLFGGIGKLFTRTVRPFTFAGRVERTYKGLIKSSLKAQGISTRNLVWDYTDILEKGALDITLMAKTKAGKPLAMITRSLSPQEIYLTSVEVGVQGAGLGKQIYSREALALRKLGYKTGTRIVSPVSSPITARWQAQLYGSQSVNKLVEDDFINRLVRGKITKQEFQSKYAGEFVGELRFSGFQEQGFSSLFRKKYGFGSGAIWKKILTFSRRLFASSTSKTSFEKLTSAMTEAEVANIFGREVASFNPAQIRSGLMDKWYIERKLGLPQEVVTRSPAQIRKEMEAGERLYRQQVVSGKIFSRNELRTMNEVEWADIRNRAIAKKEAQRQKNALKNAQIKEQIMGAEQKAQKIKKQNTLHLKAQQDFWKNSVKTGRGHVVKSSNTTVA